MSGSIGDNTARASGVVASAGGGGLDPVFLVTKSGSESVTRSVTTFVGWDTEIYDSSSAFASNKFTVPADQGGMYFFHCRMNINDNGGSSRIMFYKNGADQVTGTNESNSLTTDITWLVSLAAADYIETYVHAGEPSPAVQTNSFFSGFKVLAA